MSNKKYENLDKLIELKKAIIKVLSLLKPHIVFPLL